MCGREIRHDTKQRIGDLYPQNINNLEWENAKEIANQNIWDKLAMIIFDCISKYRFPEPRQVNFVTESTLWNQLNALYKTWYTNHIAYEYYIDEGGECLSKPQKK